MAVTGEDVGEAAEDSAFYEGNFATSAQASAQASPDASPPPQPAQPPRGALEYVRGNVEGNKTWAREKHAELT
jgi:hypothetical protein